ncbi:MAG: SH3 domain-containing protein [Bacteroidales bacterium]|nr:SH3 domain-containing protein [Bacteroidales bacterium]MCF8328665.1 SH3 domain-containing protein [Bacteroidales bacterium]
MTLRVFGLLSILFLLWSCGNNASQSDDQESKTNDTLQTKEDQQPAKALPEPGETLVITGENVNMRTQPKIGDNVIMQLDSGAEATILKRGEKAQISDMVDYWYKVDYNNREMWVYGAITNVKSENLEVEEKPENLPDNMIKGSFVQIQKNEDAKYFVMQDEQGQQHKYRIYGGYEGQEVFDDNSEDLEGINVVVSHEKQKVFLESEGKNKEINRILKVEVEE